MKIMKQYLPFVLAGLVGAGIYDAGKELVPRAFNSGPVQRTVGTFRSYDKEEVNPEKCEVDHGGTLRWGNNYVRWDSPNHLERWVGDSREGQNVYDPTKSVLNDSESPAGIGAGIYFRVSYKETPDLRCKPKVVVYENGVPLKGAKIGDYINGRGRFSLEKVVEHSESGNRTYQATLNFKSGAVQIIEIGTIPFTGKPLDTKPHVDFFHPGGSTEYLSATIHDSLDNRGTQLQSVKLTEKGEPLELKLLEKSNPLHHGVLREEWTHTPKPGKHTYTLEVVDNGGNKVTETKTFDVKVVDGKLKIVEVE